MYKLEKNNHNEIIGYGGSKSLEEARNIAIKDIVSQMSVTIKGTIVTTKLISNGKYKAEHKGETIVQTGATLSGAKIIKSQNYNGKFYVAVSYDKSLLEVKIKRKLNQKISNQKQNNYIKNTVLVQRLNKYLNKKLDFELIRKDNLWQIKYDNIFEAITEKDLYKLFVTTKNKNISISTNKTIFEDNDEIFFNIKLKNKGFISILYVDAQGKVALLMSNEYKSKSFRFPSIQSEDIFTLTNLNNDTTYELIVAIYSKEKIDLSLFEEVNEEILDENNFNFDKLIKKLNNLEFTTHKIKIKG
jgi:hypothetical protein